MESEARSRKRGPWVAVLGLAGAIALGVGLKGRFDAFTAPAASSEPKAQAPKLVTLSVAAWPVEANVVVDGQPVGSNPWSQRYPVSERKLHVEVTAPGHSSFAQDVSLETDANLSVRLEAVASASAEPPTATSTPTGRPSKPVKGRHAVSFIPAASPAAAPAAPKPDCTPPYVLDTEGVKTYKPECL